MNASQAPVACTETAASARSFVCARLRAQALTDYPGRLPRDLDEAYARQDAAIELWPDHIAGWKVGKIPDAWLARLGEERLVGPIFAGAVQWLAPEVSVPIAVIQGGFAAVEAEYIFVLGADAAADRLEWSAADAERLVGELRLGIEFAGSPLATINELGPAVVVSDFGNNAGLLVGPAVDNWRQQSWEALSCATFVGNRLVGRGGAAFLPGGPLTALAAALVRCARRGRPLKAGDLISTGASTGIHDIRVGEHARVEFAGGVVLRCHATQAHASALAPRAGGPC